MSRLAFSPAAIADIENIWDYTAETWGIEQAERYTDILRDTCYALSAGNKHGRKVDLRDGYLKYPIGRHTIYFRASVIRVLHQRMDVSRRL